MPGDTSTGEGVGLPPPRGGKGGEGGTPDARPWWECAVVMREGGTPASPPWREAKTYIHTYTHVPPLSS